MKQKQSDIDRYCKALERAKIAPFDIARLLVITPDMLKMIAVWPAVTRRRLDDVEDSGKDDAAWDMIHYDVEDWSRLSGVGMDAYSLHLIIRELGLVYPDGRMPDEVKRHVMKAVERLFEDEDED